MNDRTEVGSTRPYWWIDGPPRDQENRSLPQSVDVAIVGAGYAGLSAAITLARAGRSVAAIDKGVPGEGASTRNGGITSGNIRLSHRQLTRRFGRERADALQLEAKAAREDLYRFIADENIDCDFRLAGRFAGALSQSQYDELAREAEHLRRNLGIEAYAVPLAETRTHVGTDFYHGGSVRMDVGGIHPAKLHAGMLRLAEAAGAVVVGGTAITGVSGSEGAFTVATDKGSIAARQVIIATNGYLDGLEPWLQRRIVPVRSRIIVTEPLPPGMMDRLLPTRMMVSDKRRLTYYYRSTPDGQRLLFGGRDGTFEGDPVWPTEHLQQEMVGIFPELRDVGLSHSWFGYVAMNRDMLPRVFQRHGVHYATGCCGSGIVWLRWAGQKVAEKILGAPSRSALDFRPPRSIPLFKGKAWFMPAVFTIMKIQDRISMADGVAGRGGRRLTP
ncbi:NAD(P)/FAD-dependent oxidoreductase [Rhizobium lentis]|uniref:FAD-binding oxidoreductase n=1 Tax=Rhizobium lentis TaxID=1138194 RepID=A0ABS7ICT7_9HYPH|nr:FAD-binding oxidoreductase [Rhizobium lentis]MBX5088322.1 FAD-binding oxidoreductase [Rhizobium lentis]